jgi:hypothetical protein
VAPTGLIATPTSNTQIKLTWRHNSNDVLGFKIERRIGTGDWAAIPSVGANQTSVYDNGLRSSTNYGYRMRAYNANGDSTYSNTASKKTQSDLLGKPAVPTELSATPLSAGQMGQIRLDWRDNSNNETGFYVQRQVENGGWQRIDTLAANSTTYVNSGLTGSTTYGYRVQAYRTLRGTSAFSNEVSATTLPISPLPAVPSWSSALLASTQITVRWNDNSANETSFKIERKTGTGDWPGSEIATVAADVVEYVDSGLQPATPYVYRLRACNAAGCSAYSAELNKQTLLGPSVPAAPNGLTATPVSPTQISLGWTDNSDNETGFKIERKTGTGDWPGSEIATVAAGVIAYPNTGLAPATSYTYRIRACNAAGCSGYSNEISQTTPGAPMPQLRLNDTGIVGCADGTRNNLPCPVTGYPEQDAQFGRDRSANDNSDGHAGFSFTKLDANGNALPASATAWSCVRDNVTGRVWEEKTDDGGLRDKDWTYTWYNSNAAANGGWAGTPNGGSCSGSQCDTQGYVQAVNAAGLCGARDWRMPTVSELLSIVSNDRVRPAIDTVFFRNLPSYADSWGTSPWFWSSSHHARYSGVAYDVGFGDGRGTDGDKNYALAVRLVRGRQ